MTPIFHLVSHLILFSFYANKHIFLVNLFNKLNCMRCCTGRSLVEGSNEKSDSSTVNPTDAQAITGIPADQVFFKVPILP